MTQFLFKEMNVVPVNCQPLHAASPPPARALARANDPPTSHEAAREIVESGADESQRKKILELLQLRHATAKELVGIAVNYRQRVTELRRILEPLGQTIRVKKTISAATGGKVNIYVLEDLDA